MANDLQTLADLITERLGVSDQVASDVLNSAPFVALLPMIEASDSTTHKYPKRVGAPVAGFRSVNTGRELDKSNKVLVTAALEYLDWTFRIDHAVADANPKKTPLEHVFEEGMEALSGALFQYESQLFNGKVGGDASGFEGFRDASTMLYNDSAMVVDATGTSAGAATSVYAVRVAGADCQGVYKGDGEPFKIGDTITVEVQDGDNGSYAAYYTPSAAWLGLQLGSAYSIGRICNLTAEAGKGLSDVMLSKLLAKFPAGKPATHIVMNRPSQQQLQESRTATNPTGAPAPFPEEAFGRPIVTTDAITSTEAIVGASS